MLCVHLLPVSRWVRPAVCTRLLQKNHHIETKTTNMPHLHLATRGSEGEWAARAGARADVLAYADSYRTPLRAQRAC